MMGYQIFTTSNLGSNKLYLNKGNFKFDISKTAGVEGSNHGQLVL
jgi:hypothetical protein